jgi:uncharacterized membrane protein
VNNEHAQKEVQDRLDAISEALVRMIRRQERIEARLDQIEQAFSGAPSGTTREVSGSTVAPQHAAEVTPLIPKAIIAEQDASITEEIAAPPRSEQTAPPVSGPPPLPENSRPTATQAQPPRSSAAVSEGGLETRFGLNWLNRVAVITLILGVAFFFKFAVDNDWIGPGLRIALGVTAGMVSLAVGEWMSIRAQAIFARGMTGLGLALLYLSFYASFGFYQLLPQTVAFLLMGLTTIAAGGLALHYDSLAVATLGLLGGYLTPGLLSTGENRPWALFGYLFLLNGGAVFVGRLRKWNPPEYIAFASSCLYYFGWYMRWFAVDTQVVATVALIAFYAQFLVGGSRFLSQVGQFLVAVGVMTMWTSPSAGFGLLFLVTLSGLVAAEWKQWPEAPALTGAFFWIAVWETWRSFEWSENQGLVFGWLTLGFLILFAWAIWWVSVKKRETRPSELWLLALNSAAYFTASYSLLHRDYDEYMGALALAVAVLYALLAKTLWRPGDTKESYPGQMSAAISLTLLTLAFPIQFAGFRVTIAWALEAAACAWLARKLASIRLGIAVGLLLLLVLYRLLAFEGQIHTEQFISERLLTFVVSAASFIFATRCFKEQVLPAATAYCAGHLILLWGLGLEVAAWAERNSADVSSTTSTGISILSAIYALLLVGAGVAWRFTVNRLLGLGLFAAVVAKLYLIDVWALSRGFRMTAFLVLGALLLLVSYLYSRFKPMIEKWWRSPSDATQT